MRIALAAAFLLCFLGCSSGGDPVRHIRYKCAVCGKSQWKTDRDAAPTCCGRGMDGTR